MSALKRWTLVVALALTPAVGFAAHTALSSSSCPAGCHCPGGCTHECPRCHK